MYFRYTFEIVRNQLRIDHMSLSNTKQTKKLPIYQQITEYLSREISSGRWLPGDRLPIEAELAANLGVAIGTLRKALAKLEEDGLIERRQGSGTYVSRAPDGKPVYGFFHLELLEGGGAPSANTLIAEQRDVTFLASTFQGGSVWSIRRERMLNRRLVAMEEIFFNAAHVRSLKVDDLHESLYLHYETQFGFWISKVEDQIDCAKAPTWVCEALGFPAGTVLPRVQRWSWSNEDKVEEFSYTWFDPNKARYIARWR